MTWTAWWSAVAVLVAGLAATGCESTQDRSAQLRKRGNGLFHKQTQALVTKPNLEVKVLHAVALHDQNGSAAVVELRNASLRAQVDVPVAIDVRDAHGRSLFRNDAVGIEPSLVGPSLLAPRSDLVWVNDQVNSSGAMKSVVARVGAGRGSPPPTVPRLDVSAPRLETDPTSGLSAVGKVTNRSDIAQLKLILYCVARRGGRIVAAGRGGIDRLKPHKPTRYTIFFIGNPKGARLTVAAPPTTLR